MTEIQEYLNKGYIHCRAIFEVVGKPKEHVEEAIKLYTKKLGEDTNLVMIDTFIAETKQLEGSELFSTFAEVELLVKSFASLTELCFSYMPASIEILDPGKLTVDANKLSNLFNDFQEKLHKADLLAKTISQQNMVLIKNITKLVNNALVILLKENGLSIMELSRYVGIKEEDMLRYLDELIKEKKVRKIGEKYFLEL